MYTEEVAKAKTVFTCQNCGTKYGKWSGRCEACGEWNTLVEELVPETAKTAIGKSRAKARSLSVEKLCAAAQTETKNRLDSGFEELNLVLGGGFFPGGVVLIAGQPGIGKSTLLMQLSNHIGLKHKVLYVSGEESVTQVADRARRLKVKPDAQIAFASSVNAGDIARTIEQGKYGFAVVDSIQTVQLDELTSAPGSVSQITNSANILIRAAKNSHTVLVIVGHVTKEGSIAGPKILEHLVDVVLQFEGDRYGNFKTLRATKNRYGSTDEVAIMEMTELGLNIVANPSAQLLKERTTEDGSIILAAMEGNRPLLVEIQALVNQTNFGYPKRTASGFDVNRLNLLIAVLERRTKLKLADKDIYLNVVGGLKLNDSAADLAVAMAIASNATGRKIADDIVVFGEVGLGGEIRSVRAIGQRVKEAEKLGFTSAIGPRGDRKNPFIAEVKDLRQVLIKYLDKK